MKKYIIVIGLIIFGIKYGYDYVLSEKFQTYADKTKAPWTCKVNNFMGNIFMVGSEYNRAYDLFQRVLARCPETADAEEAEYKSADALAGMGEMRRAVAAYEAYAEAHKGTKRAGLASKAAGGIRLGL